MMHLKSAMRIGPPFIMIKNLKVTKKLENTLHKNITRNKTFKGANIFSEAVLGSMSFYSAILGHI